MTDHHNLDGATAGRSARAGMAGTAVALPERIISRAPRALVTLVIGIGGISALVVRAASKIAHQRRIQA